MTSAVPFAVTVTYGQRRGLLEQMLTATLGEGIRDVFIVDNGAAWNIQELVSQYPVARMHIISMGKNTGSAAGFSAGISAAMQAGAEMVWLLDDDNRPLPGALHALLQTYDRLHKENIEQHVALLAYRPEHQADVASGIPLARINPRRSSFLGFHIFDLPYKFWKRTGWGKPKPPDNLPNTVELHVAPYSGLLLQRKTIEAIGLPRTDFVLYADDTEFTHRIVLKGGRIVLVSSALFEDMESSWNIKRRSATSIHGLLSGSGDFRAYYGLRNEAYFQLHCRSPNVLVYWINRFCYMALLRVVALTSKSMPRYHLIAGAIRDGTHGRLGVHPSYPL